MHARFSVTQFDNGVICIWDEGYGTVRSVTNDADWVIDEVAKRYPDLHTRKVIYRDSNGIWDGIHVNKKNKFDGFYFIGKTTLEDALKFLEDRK